MSMNSSVAIVSIMSYPFWYKGKLRSIKHTDKIRGDLALDFVKKSLSLGCVTVVAEGQSSKTFKKELRGVNGAHVISKNTLKRSPKRRAGIHFAAQIKGIKAIILTEPEKISLLSDCLELLTKPLLKDEADIVVPRRKADLFKSTYPQYMFESEIEGNKIYNEALRTQGLLPTKSPDLDMFFGPRAFGNRDEIVAFFLKKFTIKQNRMHTLNSLFDVEEYGNAGFFPVILALKKRMRVMDIEVPFSYPKIQKENEEIGSREEFVAKRQLQRTSILVDLMHLIGYLDRKRDAGLKLE